MNRPNEQYAYFAAWGDFDPDDLTRRVGIEPDESWKVGDVHPRTRRERRFSAWKLHSGLSHSEPIEAHVRAVLDRLAAAPEAFAALSREISGCMQVVGYFHEGYPGVELDADLIARLASYGLSVDFDFYDLCSDAREAT